MAFIIDRRKNGKNKSSENRQKFLRRYKQSISEAVKKGVTNRKISDVDKKGVDIQITRKSISEPSFQHDYETGERRGVNPGNYQYVQGDRIKKQPQQGGGGSGAGNGGDGEDSFTFSISRDEFMEYFFSDVELPNMMKKTLTGSNHFDIERAGHSSVGIPANLDLPRSMISAIGRRFALRGSHSREVTRLQLELEDLQALREDDRTEEQQERMGAILEEIKYHEERSTKIPFIDDFDLKFKLHKKIPKPTRKAVMFCMMDVSGSMGEHEKDLAKRFYTLLYIFLGRVYDQVDIRFIRHHHEAREVDEESFFYAKDSGGTVVSTGFELMNDIIKSSYNDNEWNIYVAQTSDGDNWETDDTLLKKMLNEQIMPKIQHFAYLEVGRQGDFRTQDGYTTSVWQTYEPIMERWAGQMDMQKLYELNDVGDVFKRLYKKRTAAK